VVVLEPDKLDPEIKWRTMVGFFLNYVTAMYSTIKEKFSEEMAKELQEVALKSFGEEQGIAIAQIFGLSSDSAKDVSLLKRVMATVFDIKYKCIKSTDHEVIDEMEYLHCPIRRACQPVWKNICEYCEFLGQTFLQQINPDFNHKIEIDETVCRHFTQRKAE